MKTVKCPACGGKTKRNGKTSSGAQRWRCTSCGASTTQKYNSASADLKAFLLWLLSKKTQSECDSTARRFQRRTSKFWTIWPVSPVCNEIHHVIHVDGIWLKRICVILIACNDEGHTVGWYLARSENSHAWKALMSRIAPPDVVVTDGGDGFEKARRQVWSNTRVQRCTFHVFNQVKRCTTTRPRTQAGVDLYAIAKELLKVATQEEAACWLASFANWCSKYEEFLKEKTVVDGKKQYKHERLRKARRALTALCKADTLFTYLDEELLAEGPIPATNNRIEGLNTQIRSILREHRGMHLDHMIKAVFWYCLSKLENPMDAAQILKEMPTDETIAQLYQASENMNKKEELVERWGTAVSWSDLHTSSPWQSDCD